MVHTGGSGGFCKAGSVGGAIDIHVPSRPRATGAYGALFQGISSPGMSLPCGVPQPAASHLQPQTYVLQQPQGSTVHPHRCAAGATSPYSRQLPSLPLSIQVWVGNLHLLSRDATQLSDRVTLQGRASKFHS